MTATTIDVTPYVPSPGEPLRLLHVHAHPDDEASKGAATTVKYVREGVQVLVVTCTGGERGDVLNPALDIDPAEVPAIRRAEMAEAAAILGVEHRWLGFIDSGFPEGDPLPPLPDGCFAALPLDATAEPLVAIIREFRPHVLTTYDEHGGYPHPDHVRTHDVTIRAFEAAADPQQFPQAGEPWQPLKLYYQLTFSKDRVIALHEAIVKTGHDSPFAEWLESWEDKPEDANRLTTRIEAADFFPDRNAALKAHRTQVDPDGEWFRLSLEIERAAWPTEDFQLARSLVDAQFAPDGYEHDLFSGLRVTTT